MKRALLVAFMCMVPFKPNIELLDTLTEAKYIKENNLEYVRVTCYLPTGYNCADGTPPYEGVISSNKEHLGMDAILYDDNLIPFARMQCRDIGGHKDLVSGKAIDVFRNDMNRAWEYIGEHSNHCYVRWVERDWVEDGEEFQSYIYE